MPNVQLPTAQEQVSTTTGLFSFSWFNYLQGVYRSIRADLKLRLGGTLNLNTTSASNSSTTETDLISYNLAGGYLKTTGDSLDVKAWGVYAANGNNKTVKLKFGSQTILDTGAIAANDGAWSITATIIRTGATTQEIIAEIISGNGSVAESAVRTVGSQTLASDITIKCTGQGGASEDVVQYAQIIKLNPYD